MEYKINKETILKYNMKDEFPEVFEVELKVGEWYKNDIGSLINYQSIDYGYIVGYGFSRFKEWTNNYIMCGEYTEATQQEVEESLICEAIKRYKVGDYIKDMDGFYLGDCNMIFDNKSFVIDSDGSFCVKSTNSYWMPLMKSGKWAEIIPTITKQEAEDKLGCKIVD